MSYTRPKVSEFKCYFTRDFPYQPVNLTPDLNLYIQDSDIRRAQGEAEFTANESLFSTQELFDVGFNYITAHYLAMNLNNSSQGVAGSFNFQESSKGVGSVSQSFAIPQTITDNPSYSWLMKTSYGAYYLFLIYPYLIGNVGVVAGATKA